MRQSPPHARLLLGAAAVALVIALSSPAGAADPKPAAYPIGKVPLALDVGNATELFPNQSVTGSMGAFAPRYFKVFANRSLSAPETLTLTLEATGSLFGSGWLSVFDPLQLLLDERFTRSPGDLNVSNIIAAETGFYLLVVESDQAYDWAVTVNLTVNASSFTDADNDLANATGLTGTSGSVNDSVADFADLADNIALGLNVYGATEDALLVDLTSPNTADLDLYVFHLEAGVAVVDGASLSPTGTEHAAALATANQTYFVRVLSYAGSSNYTLSWSRLNVSADDNGEVAKATPLVSGSYLNNLSRWDTRDLFRLDLAANTTVNISLHTEGFNATTRTPDLQAVLWDANFSRVSWSFTFDPDERINAVVPNTGSYYLDIFGADILYYLTTRLSFNYTMQVAIDPPPALADPAWSATFAEDQVGLVDLRSVIPPNPVFETIAYAVSGSEAHVRASVAPDGYTLSVVPDADWSGAAWVNVSAQDAWRAVEVRLPIVFLAVNDAPRLAQGAGAIAFDEDGSAFLDLGSAIVDPEGDPWSVMSLAPEPPLIAQAVTGGFNLSAPQDFHGTLALVLLAQDVAGAADNVTFVVTVRPVNDPPAFARPAGPFVLEEDASAEQATFNLTGLAVDPDGDAISYSLRGPSSVAALIVGDRLSLYPARDFWGNLSATLVAFDGIAATPAIVLIQVLPVNDPPLLVIPAAVPVAHEGANFTFSVAADDPDSPASALVFSFWLDGVLLAENQSRGSLSHFFGFEDAGSHVMRVLVSDGSLTAAADVPLFVAETNRAPLAQILTPRNATFRVGEAVAFSARALDPDGTPVNITWIVDGTAVSSSATFSLDSLSVGRHTVTLRVYDGDLAAFDSTTVDVQGGLPGFDITAVLAAVGACALLARRARRA